MENNAFKVTLGLKKHDTEIPVVHKQDGQRFSRCNTVKFNTNTAYDVTVTIRPELTLREMLIQGEKVELTRVKPEKILEDDCCIFRAEWTSTGFSSSKSGSRKDLNINFEFTNQITMMVSIQCKFYEDSENQHCKWGQPLHNIEYDCLIKDGQSFVDILKEKYF
ncbi:hypothetical protein SNE40_009057 [Patella caerulea]|uniref:CB1 cannabinoid receptor-interacting protein 1 n=1 Tax=Patella caerulea TaxID=87958 RepID=A0AAN8JU87_PATCE